jgi:hypothetical protein
MDKKMFYEMKRRADRHKTFAIILSLSIRLAGGTLPVKNTLAYFTSVEDKNIIT